MPRRLAAALLVGLTAVTFAACAERTPPIDIPDGIPPGVGAPLPPIDVEAPGRSADQLQAWAEEQDAALGVGRTALEAYGYAAAVMTSSRPGCGIGWTTLAGISGVESRHGTHGGAYVAPNGRVDPVIRGIPLDGGPGIEEIPDTDGGALDGDPIHDRAMGPMQFIPETWKRWGVDANGDGVADPDSVDDATLTAARYLCERGGDLTTPEGWHNALMAYNLSGVYMGQVRDRASAYSVGVPAD